MKNDLDFEIEELLQDITNRIQDIPEFLDMDIEIEVEIED